MAEERNHFDSSRAELFEALGHPTRVKILRALDARQMGFAELKREVGIESSGHLQFHLGKLTGLVGTTAEGFYMLTDDGKEALHVVSVTSESHRGGGNRTWTRPTLVRAMLVTVIVAMIMLSAFAVVQQQQISSLNRSLSQQPGTVVIDGTRYADVEMPLSSLNLPTSVKLDGVTFNLTATTPGGQMLVTFTGENITSQPGQEQVLQLTIRFAPTITVIFGDGQQESYGSAATPAFRNGTTSYVIGYSTVNPWFSLHKNPQAGVSWNPTTAMYTFYVSLGH